MVNETAEHAHYKLSTLCRFSLFSTEGCCEGSASRQEALRSTAGLHRPLPLPLGLCPHLPAPMQREDLLQPLDTRAACSRLCDPGEIVRKTCSSTIMRM